LTERERAPDEGRSTRDLRETERELEGAVDREERAGLQGAGVTAEDDFRNRGEDVGPDQSARKLKRASRSQSAGKTPTRTVSAAETTIEVTR
jgi:hypothetical protein